MSWTPTSWRNFPAQHQALRAREPLVPVEEIVALKKELANVAVGNALCLQGGDCAETFADATDARTYAQLELVGEVAARISTRSGKDVVRIARFAGQFAKPRSQPYEVRGAVELPSYLGDLINDFEFEDRARAHDPHRMLRGYDIARQMLNSLAVISKTHKRPYFTAHEGLHLLYEEALLRGTSDGEFYAQSSHFLWIGDRTRVLSDAHIEFFRGLANPIGVKLSGSATAHDVVAMARTLDPHRTPGRLTFVTRFGADIAKLTELVRAVDAWPIIWLCDPMHGNTERHTAYAKQRHVPAMLNELSATSHILKTNGRSLCGLHCEFAIDAAYECADTDGEVLDNTRTPCDPRFNARQMLGFADAFVALTTRD